jgi:hypothetical protein
MTTNSDEKHLEKSLVEAQNIDITPNEQEVWEALNAPTEEERNQQFLEVMKSLLGSTTFADIQPLQDSIRREIFTLRVNGKSK